jgi:hypothetical protein
MEANASTTLTFTSNTNITGIESPEDIHVKAIKMSGKQYRIEAKIETSSFRQERVIEWIKIHSSLENGVTCADINLQVTCPILPALKATPERIFLGELKVNAHSQAEVVVSALNQRSFWISQARCKGTESTVDWDRGLWESSHKLRVKCLARTPGPASDSIRIETDGDIKAELEVHVYWITKE